MSERVSRESARPRRLSLPSRSGIRIGTETSGDSRSSLRSLVVLSFREILPFRGCFFDVFLGWYIVAVAAVLVVMPGPRFLFRPFFRGASGSSAAGPAKCGSGNDGRCRCPNPFAAGISCSLFREMPGGSGICNGKKRTCTRISMRVHVRLRSEYLSEGGGTMLRVVLRIRTFGSSPVRRGAGMRKENSFVSPLPSVTSSARPAGRVRRPTGRPKWLR